MENDSLLNIFPNIHTDETTLNFVPCIAPPHCVVL